jgi:hypothetical protein
MERGHEIQFGPFGHVPTSVRRMIMDGIDGVLILTDEDVLVFAFYHVPSRQGHKSGKM